MAMDLSALLTSIESAIEALLNGGHTSYSIGGRSVSKLDLPQLFAERRTLISEIARESSSTSVFRLAKMGRPSQ